MKRWPLQLGIEPAYQDDASMVIHGDCFEVPVPMVDAIIVDPPFSRTTHEGHDASSDRTRRVRRGRIEPHRSGGRRSINYKWWDENDVKRYVDLWIPRCRGWFVVMTDDMLSPVWRQMLADAGRYPFAPVPFVWPGGRFRKAGDGPACVTTWIIVARPRRAPYSKWGRYHRTPAAEYRLPAGLGQEVKKIGGKPVWLLERLVEDYTRDGDVIVDTCAGHGTTGVAAKRLRRKAVLVERAEDDVRECASRLALTKEQIRMRLDDLAESVLTEQTQIQGLQATA